jgi:ribose/xylose/arabinose/galactoside ABC-type transport system permease subunit
LSLHRSGRASAAPRTLLGPLDAEIQGLLAALIVLRVLAMLFAPNFATTRILLDVLRQVAFTGIIAYSMTLVIVAGEIDRCKRQLGDSGFLRVCSAYSRPLSTSPLSSAALAVVALGNRCCWLWRLVVAGRPVG